ncbi:MAG: CsbD family protein [Thermosynechococcaceae cyanobacterium]
MNIKIRSLAAKALAGLFLIVTVVTVSLSTPLNSGVAIAAPIHQPIAALFGRADRKAKSDLDSTVGAGTSNKLEGAVQEATGTVQSKIGNAQNRAEGTAKKLDGRAKRDVGQVQGTAEDIGSEVQDAAKGITDSVKGLLN